MRRCKGRAGVSRAFLSGGPDAGPAHVAHRCAQSISIGLLQPECPLRTRAIDAGGGVKSTMYQLDWDFAHGSRKTAVARREEAPCRS